ncbi:MAG: hypothetical protein PHT40_01370 [Patescibacteria group bacterium]|nr:hypothetical protein [Patescibacteria group bacterium]
MKIEAAPTVDLKDKFSSKEEGDLLHELKNKRCAIETGFQMIEENRYKAEVLVAMKNALVRIREIMDKLNLEEPENGQLIEWERRLAQYQNN